MSSADVNRTQALLKLVSQQLREAAEHYRWAWQAQRRATESWYEALAAIATEYAEGSPPEVAKALEAFNAAVEECALLGIEVGDDEALREMEAATHKLEAVADAARDVAAALVRTGVLQ